MRVGGLVCGGVNDGVGRVRVGNLQLVIARVNKTKPSKSTPDIGFGIF